MITFILIAVILYQGVVNYMIRRELDSLWRQLKSVITLAAKWAKEDKERLNAVVADINKYYSGRGGK